MYKLKGQSSDSEKQYDFSDPFCSARFLLQGDRHLRVPDRRTIVRWVQSWREHGKVENKKSSGRPRTVRTPENINRVRAEIQQSPQRSARRHSLTMQISDRFTEY
ncbi:hypothetical protein C0J52_27245 [Blattella germanica]|nr:hypothetical protein C0J52_27245 [Blattella germanica]